MSALRDISATSFWSANLIKEALLQRQNSPFKRAFSAKWLVKMETNYFESWNHFPPYCSSPIKNTAPHALHSLKFRNFSPPATIFDFKGNKFIADYFVLFLEGVAQEQEGGFWSRDSHTE
ncbi:hypothetical protein CDAR_597271 [Caerostris darwini]|uniref:Uncharacterized protein n=1 Tax=Caerostris darwini TaxID=1538125 RepID=A0AAV4U2J4_9ARAC|nr:hypothetical protein CDAR_597271 [Caerostris darwini]